MACDTTYEPRMSVGFRYEPRIELGMPRIPASYTSRASYRKNLTRLVYKARTQNAYEAHRAEARILGS